MSDNISPPTNAPIQKADAAKKLPANPLIEYLDSILRGSSQVVLVNNPLTGLMNFIAFFVAAYLGATPYAVAWGALVGTAVSTATAYFIVTDLNSRKSGLYGFNGLLVGAAIPTFFACTGISWAILVLACAVSTLVTVAVGKVLDSWQTPGLTFPFVLTTWLIMLAAYKLNGLSITALPQPSMAAQASSKALDLSALDIITACFASIGQVFFIDHPLCGAIFLLGLIIGSRRVAAYALLGALLAVPSSLLPKADSNLILHGLWGYSSVLTAVALGGVFLPATAKVFAYTSVAAIFTVFVQGATASFTETFGLPALTFPFVLTTWLFLLAYTDSEK